MLGFLFVCTHSKYLCPLFQALFRKAMVLHEMGEVNKSLQVFLHCLAVDEDFPCAKRQVEKVRYIYIVLVCCKSVGKRILGFAVILKLLAKLS